MGLTYFAADGSYGDAAGLIVVDTTGWDVDDWDHIELAPESDRLHIAREMSDSKDPNQLELPL